MQVDDLARVCHNAGKMVDLVQRCTRCGVVIIDYRNTFFAPGDSPGTGFAEGPITFVGTKEDGASATLTGELEGAVRCGADA